ncbi:iron ABC transporter permease [Sphaerisporangium krabiense]|uniref:Iron complex transport system permease protein n=1 Tax=Sphaerisporangium krabiense TaxID=763782 RepID=A0A7W8Z9F8_9ACTN|nr:iron chelate uptake ABC transporter family permease subunit [Sphaerisporangium krabiense]MBB5629869.1 iron complex transport system permease protein [Sphaerisporangium krabiense]GII63970.1 iron ABC transporter permease [Sphaerisporangium krabiense]
MVRTSGGTRPGDTAAVPMRRHFRLTVPPVSGVLRPRLVAVCAALLAATFLVFCWGVSMGDVPIGLTAVMKALVGQGDPGTLLVVRELRLPRALVGLLAGVAFAVSGALFQTMTRNPLASPDMIGLTEGAGTAVVAGIVLGWDAGVGVQALGLTGALATALLVYLLAWRRGTTGYRIILVGIGLSWICTSATDFLVARGGRFQAQAALGWLVGNLNGRSFEDAVPLAVAVAVLVPATLVLGRLLRTLQLGDDVAAALGTRVQAVRLGLMLTGVGLVAFATAAAGPIAFVALAAPQIAQRLAGAAHPPPVASALTGALVVLGGDLAARMLIPGTELPVGVVTGVLGAPVLLWLLIRVNRAGSGG